MDGTANGQMNAKDTSLISNIKVIMFYMHIGIGTNVTAMCYRLLYVYTIKVL